jgi:hypothetical protein
MLGVSHNYLSKFSSCNSTPWKDGALTQSPSFLPCGTPISSKVCGPLPGGRALDAGGAGLADVTETFVEGAEGLAEATLGRGLLFAAAVGRGFSVSFCCLGPEPTGRFDDVLGGCACGVPVLGCIGL